MSYAFLFFAAILQSTFMNPAAGGNIKPDILLIFTVFFALRKDTADAVNTGILAGFLKDIFSAGVFLNTLTFPLCGFLISFFAKKFYFYKQKMPVQLLAVFISAVFVSFLYAFWFAGQYYSSSFISLSIFTGLPAVLYTTFFAAPVFFILEKFI